MHERVQILLLLTLAIVGISQMPFGARLEENVGLDLLYRARGPIEAPEGAAIIAIDEGSVDWLHRNSVRLGSVAPELAGCMADDAGPRLAGMRHVGEIPRDVFACLVDRLAAADPRLVTFDIAFSVPQPEDGRFADAIRRAGNVLLFESVEKRTPPGSAGPPLIMRRGPVGALQEAALGTVGFRVESAPGGMTIRYRTRNAAFPDLRMMPVEAYRLTDGRTPELNDRELFWLYGPARTIPTWTLREIFASDSAQRPVVRDRAVFIGVTNQGSEMRRDDFPVPAFGPTISGVELAGTAFLNLRAGDRLVTTGAGGQAVVAALLALAFGSAALLVPRRLAIGSALAVGAAAAALALLLFHQGVWLPVAAPLLIGLPLTVLVAFERRLRFARRVAAALLPRSISDEVLEGGTSDPRTQPASAMFVDIAGSTGLAERLGSEAYSDMLERYYSTVSDAVDQSGGAVYEFQGDGILALFSERDAGPAYARKACEAARGIERALTAGWSGSGPVTLRIGIATGPIVVGTLRFGGHISLSTMGDAVNRAFRLQEMGRSLVSEDRAPRVVVLIDGETAAMAAVGEREVRLHATTRLRGRSSLTTVYSLRSAEPVEAGVERRPAS